MRVPDITPCVCADHEPDAEDSVYFGMPQLKVCSWDGKQLFEPYCPNCGRGGLYQFGSAYLALKWWNELQAAELRVAEILDVEDDGHPDP